ncbi:hypothetical protein HMPREF9466_03177 [Fusobacterium necrophorum subsp. funduliforme 1_1_36S]|nr:hypothetical protein HMPREF9466_03177 [Fusobacterium necrophorum subsp. funduliforme 1_1_36S]
MCIFQKKKENKKYLFILIFSIFIREISFSQYSLPHDIEMSDSTLREVLDEIEECLPVQIKVDEDLKDPLNLFFREGQKVEEVLEMLAEITNKKVRRISSKKYQLESMSTEKEGKLKEYHLSYLRSREVCDTLKELFPSEVKVANLESRNKIIIMATDKKIQEIDKIIQEIDIEGKQVKVYSQVLDISKDLFHELGFDWLYEKPSKQKNQFSVSVLGEESAGNSGPVLGSKWNLIRQFSNAAEVLGLSFKLLEAKQDLKITSSPAILIAHGNTGEFKITEEVIVGEKKRRKKESILLWSPFLKKLDLF